MTFEQAAVLLREGKRIARMRWHGPTKFIYLVGESKIPWDSLRNEAHKQIASTPGTPDQIVRINSHIDMYELHGTITVGWMPTHEDMLADDWEVAE